MLWAFLPEIAIAKITNLIQPQYCLQKQAQMFAQHVNSEKTCFDFRVN